EQGAEKPIWSGAASVVRRRLDSLTTKMLINPKRRRCRPLQICSFGHRIRVFQQTRTDTNCDTRVWSGLTHSPSVLVGSDSYAPTQIYRQNISAHRCSDHNVRILAYRDIRLVVYA